MAGSTAYETHRAITAVTVIRRNGHALLRHEQLIRPAPRAARRLLPDRAPR
ncbi:hypothetical protein ACWGKW_40860 [Streptomyces sp. NPDC054766]